MNLAANLPLTTTAQDSELSPMTSFQMQTWGKLDNANTGGKIYFLHSWLG